MSEKLTVFLTFLFADTFTAHRERRKIQTITDSTELSDFLPIFLTTHQAEKSERREPQLHDKLEQKNVRFSAGFSDKSPWSEISVIHIVEKLPAPRARTNLLTIQIRMSDF